MAWAWDWDWDRYPKPCRPEGAQSLRINSQAFKKPQEAIRWSITGRLEVRGIDGGQRACLHGQIGLDVAMGGEGAFVAELWALLGLQGADFV